MFLGYPKCGEQDTLAPWEMLKSLAWVMSQKGLQLDVKLGAFEEGNITMQMGAVVASEILLTPQSRADLLYVPGGTGSGDACKNEPILDLIRAHRADGKWIATNCSGIAILQRAKVLSDAPVTAAATVSRRLLQEGVNVLQPRKTWVYSPDQRLFTAAGGSAVHPSTVALVWNLFGENWGKTLALMWDTLGAIGKKLAEPIGPDYGSYPAYESDLQDQWEDALLPKLEKTIR